jgi:hypothetical protein
MAGCALHHLIDEALVCRAAEGLCEVRVGSVRWPLMDDPVRRAAADVARNGFVTRRVTRGGIG